MVETRRVNNVEKDGPPELQLDRIPLWDGIRCWGTLHKKGGTVGRITSRRNWTERVFVIPHKIDHEANYELVYFKGEPDWKKGMDKVIQQARGRLSLAGCSVSNINHRKGFDFQLHGAYPRRTGKASDVAPNRPRWTREEASTPREEAPIPRDDAPTPRDEASTPRDEASTPRNEATTPRDEASTPRDDSLQIPVGNLRDEIESETANVNDEMEGSCQGDRQVSQEQWHMFSMRLNVDLASHPPDSPEREQLCIKLDQDLRGVLCEWAVRVVDIRPAINFDWLTVVDFEVKAYAPISEIAARLNAAVADRDSRLYDGEATAFVDSTYGVVQSGHNTIASRESNVERILARYDRLQCSGDQLFFYIGLRHAGEIHQLQVLDPRVVRRSACWVMPHQVLDALGLGGPSAPWIEVLALKLACVAPVLSIPIPFSPQPSLGGLRAIPSTALRRNAHYDVRLDDRRHEAFDNLDEIDRAKIAAFLLRYGGSEDDRPLPRSELKAELCRLAAEARALVREQRNTYAALHVDNPIRQSEVDALQVQHINRLDRSERTACRSADDADNAGFISKIDSTLILATWIKTTLDPNRLRLFYTTD